MTSSFLAELSVVVDTQIYINFGIIRLDLYNFIATGGQGVRFTHTSDLGPICISARLVFC